jgi:hypothetical protein
MHFFLPLRRITAGGLVVRQPARQAARSFSDLNPDAILQRVTNGAAACIKADHFKVGIFDSKRRICASSAPLATSADLRAEGQGRLRKKSPGQMAKMPPCASKPAACRGRIWRNHGADGDIAGASLPPDKQDHHLGSNPLEWHSLYTSKLRRRPERRNQRGDPVLRRSQAKCSASCACHSSHAANRASTRASSA